jgi:hypothetical protein
MQEHQCVGTDGIWVGLQACVHAFQGSNVAITCDNVSAIAHSLITQSGGTLIRQMSDLAVKICMWAEYKQMTLIPIHFSGYLNVLADELSRKHQILSSEWSLDQTIEDAYLVAKCNKRVDGPFILSNN